MGGHGHRPSCTQTVGSVASIEIDPQDQSEVDELLRQWFRETGAPPDAAPGTCLPAEKCHPHPATWP